LTEPTTKTWRRTKGVIGTQEENLVIEALMHFFGVTPVHGDATRRWAARAIDAVGTVIHMLPADAREEILAAVTLEYAEHTGAATDDIHKRSSPEQSDWLPHAREFALARFQFLMDTSYTK
jgi:hypothetical protein